MRSLRVGTRGSLLARRQTSWVIAKIKDKFPDIEVKEEIISTSGDWHSEVPLSKLPQIGDKGLFTRELEEAIISGAIDLAVHSMKDLPTDLSEGLTVGAVPERANPLDAVITKGEGGLDTLPAGSRIGTSSPRRAAQVRRSYPLLEIADIRGNLDTRLRKLEQGQVDALILAAAGLERIAWNPCGYLTIDPEISLPAPGQGALAIEIRQDDALVRQICDEALDDRSTRLAVTAERAFLLGLGGGCQVPVGALAVVRENMLKLRGIVIQLDGKRYLSGQAVVKPTAAFDVGIALANRLLDQGAKEILDGGR